MQHLQTLKKQIDRQVASNRGKNLYNSDRDSLFLFPNEYQLQYRKPLFQQMLLNPAQQNQLIEYAVDKVLEEFFNTNQYIDVNEKDKAILHKIYKKLYDELSDQELSHHQISSRHFARLAWWLSDSNPHLERINPPSQKLATRTVCSEYSADVQLQILSIDLQNIEEPVLDLGCGSNAHLAKFLNEKGIQVLGIDRMLKEKKEYLKDVNWFDFKFEPETWGTIVSNLAFSSHFQNNHLRQGGQFVAFGKKYMEILHSLKPGGSFHYAPSMPFIEIYLDPGAYKIVTKKINETYEMTIVTRL